MRIVLGSIIGAVIAFFAIDRLIILVKVDLLLGLLLWLTTPILGAGIGAYCSYRIDWRSKSVIFTCRLSAICALIGGGIELFFPIDNYIISPLADILNSSLRFLYGAVIGGSAGACLGYLLYRRVTYRLAQPVSKFTAEASNDTWPPPPLL